MNYYYPTSSSTNKRGHTTTSFAKVLNFHTTNSTFTTMSIRSSFLSISFLCCIPSSASNTNNKHQKHINSRGFSTKINTNICPQPSRCNIPSIDHTDHATFINLYRQTTPVILRGATLEWPAVVAKNNKDQFTYDYLHDTFLHNESLNVGDSLHIVSSVGLSESPKLKLSDHLDDMQALRHIDDRINKTGNKHKITPSRHQTKPLKDGNTLTDEPMYIFHRGPWLNWQLSNSQYTSNIDSIRDSLQQTCTPINPFINKSSNFIEYILGIGASGSGTTFHRHGETWLHMIEGTKRFIIYPPSTLPPLQYQTEVSQHDWIKNIYELNDKKVSTIRTHECEIRRGDVLYVPEGWYHSTINCDETVALAIQSMPRSIPLGVSELQIENVWRKKQGKLKTKLLDTLYKRSLQIAPHSPIINVLWSESNVKINTMKRINTAVKMARKALHLAPNTANVRICMAQVLSRRVTKRIQKYNITQKNSQQIVQDMSEMVNHINAALKLDKLIKNTGGTFIPTAIFQLFEFMQDVLPKLGENFLLDLGLDIVEEKAREALQTAFLIRLQNSVDAQACLWQEEYRWYFPESPTGSPNNWQYFKDHQKDIKETYVGKKKSYEFQDELYYQRYWDQAETPVQRFAKKLHDIGGTTLALYSAPQDCNINGTRDIVYVKDLLNQMSLLEKGDKGDGKKKKEDLEEGIKVVWKGNPVVHNTKKEL